MQINLKLMPVVFVLFLHASLCNAQSSIRGSVSDGTGQPLAGTSMLLYKSTDSTLVKGSVTTKEGTFHFDNLSSDRYYILASFTGFKDAITGAGCCISTATSDLLNNCSSTIGGS